MNEREFFALIKELNDPSYTLSRMKTVINKIYTITKTSEIRDFDWIDNGDNCSICLYSAIWNSMQHCWGLSLEISIEGKSSPTVIDEDLEYQLLEIWYYIVTLPEFDHDYASSFLSGDQTDRSSDSSFHMNSTIPNAVLWRIVTLSISQPSGAQSEPYLVQRRLTVLKALLHWSYCKCIQLRVHIRALVGKFLLTSFNNKKSNSLENDNSAFKDDDDWKSKGGPVMLGATACPSMGSTDAGSSRRHVFHLLQVLQCIILGFDIKAHKGSHENDISSVAARDFILELRSILTDVLLPLHEPNEMVEWRDQVPVLQGYHEILVQCMIGVIEKERSIASHQVNETSVTMSIKAILSSWPDKFRTNTPKQVLLLHELDILIGICSSEEFISIKDAILDRVVRCIGTDADNIRPAQRALQMFRNRTFLKFLTTADSTLSTSLDNASECLRLLIPALYRSGQMSWNPSVNKMTGLALQQLKESNLQLFMKICRELLGASERSNLNKHAYLSSKSVLPPRPGKQSDRSDGDSGERLHLPAIPANGCNAVEKYTDLKHSLLNNANQSIGAGAVLDSQEDTLSGISTTAKMGPPIPRNRPVKCMKLPPTGKNFGSRASDAPPNNPSSKWAQYSADNPPPVTITGVAPWAVNVTTKSKQFVHNRNAKPFQPMIECGQTNGSDFDGFELMEGYIKRCLPDSTSLDAEQQRAEDWNSQQAAATPTLLPTLKFHDLVFGAVLGEGAFSVVKYARRITKDKTQSGWAEYAVKIISAAKIQEMEYRSSVIREMAILQLLSHPGVSRMVAAFRYKDSAYLVLEYAARGDLHSFLLAHGKVSHKLTRFIAGELVAALKSVHDLGFSYGDLKPENVLLTEIGHIKLTDFGACRPVSANARNMLKDSEGLLQTIRNGDWKEDSRNPDSNAFDCQVAIDDKDISLERLEGTPAYLPPEVLLLHHMYATKAVSESANGQSTSKHQALLNLIHPEIPQSLGGGGFLSDAWALGCLIFFCLHGRPLYYGDADQVLGQIQDSYRASIVEHQSSGLHFSTEAVMGKQITYSCDNHYESTANHPEDGDTIITNLQDAAAEELISQLTDLKFTARSSVEQCIDADYLTLGYRKADQSRILGIDSKIDNMTDSNAAVTTALPTPMKPLQLHKGAPMPFPDVKVRQGCDLVDQQWSRRQFSVLWAPMPADYQLSIASSGAQSRSDGSSAVKMLGVESNSDLWLMNNAYELSPIAESPVEAGSLFKPQ